MNRGADLDRYTPSEQAILKSLGSKYLGERLSVERTLREMGPAGATLLLQFMNDEILLGKRKKKIFFGVLAGVGAVAVSVAAAVVLTGNPASIAGLSGFAGFTGLIALLAPTQRYYHIINALSQLDDVRAVGPLAEALSTQDINTRMAAVRALSKLLPKLTSEDADLFTISQRAALHKLLNTGAPEKESGLMLTVIDALTAIQDVSALPTMEMLTRRTTQTANEEAVTHAAAESAEILREAKLRQDSPQTLLRASAEATAPAQLLRAAQYSDETPAEQLLRAGNQQ